MPPTPICAGDFVGTETCASGECHSSSVELFASTLRTVSSRRDFASVPLASVQRIDHQERWAIRRYIVVGCPKTVLSRYSPQKAFLLVCGKTWAAQRYVHASLCPRCGKSIHAHSDSKTGFRAQPFVEICHFPPGPGKGDINFKRPDSFEYIGQPVAVGGKNGVQLSSADVRRNGSPFDP